MGCISEDSCSAMSSDDGMASDRETRRLFLEATVCRLFVFRDATRGSIYLGAKISQGLDPHLKLPRLLTLSTLLTTSTKATESRTKLGSSCVKLFRVELFSIRDGRDSDVILSQA